MWTRIRSGCGEKGLAVELLLNSDLISGSLWSDLGKDFLVCVNLIGTSRRNTQVQPNHVFNVCLTVFIALGNLKRALPTTLHCLLFCHPHKRIWGRGRNIWQCKHNMLLYGSLGFEQNCRWPECDGRGQGHVSARIDKLFEIFSYPLCFAGKRSLGSLELCPLGSLINLK